MSVLGGSYRAVLMGSPPPPRLSALLVSLTKGCFTPDYLFHCIFIFYRYVIAMCVNFLYQDILQSFQYKILYNIYKLYRDLCAWCVRLSIFTFSLIHTLETVIDTKTDCDFSQRICRGKTGLRSLSETNVSFFSLIYIYIYNHCTDDR